MKVYVHRRRPDRVSAWLGDAGFTVAGQLLLDLDTSAPGAVLEQHTANSTAAEAVDELVAVSRSAGFPISADKAWAIMRETRV